MGSRWTARSFRWIVALRKSIALYVVYRTRRLDERDYGHEDTASTMRAVPFRAKTLAPGPRMNDSAY